MGGLDDFADNDPGLMRVLFEPLGQLFVDQSLNRGTHLGRHQLVFCLGAELWVRHFDRQHACQTFTRIVAGKVDLFFLGDARRLRISVDRPRQRAAKARHMRAAIALRDVVGKGQHVLMVAVVPPHRDLDTDVVPFAGNKDRFRHDRGFGAVEVFHEFLNATLIEQFSAQRLSRAFIAQNDPHTGVQERQFAQTLFQRLE